MSGNLLTAIVAIAGILGTVLSQWLSGRSSLAAERLQDAHRREEQREARREERVGARREAYGRYLEAQQAMAPLLKTIEPSPLPLEEARREYFSNRTEPEFLESGTAEMYAALLAGQDVQDAIADFERFIAELIDRSLERQVSYAAWSDDWERARNRLITVMANEVQRDLDGPPE